LKTSLYVHRAWLLELNFVSCWNKMEVPPPPSLIVTISKMKSKDGSLLFELSYNANL
jgi:hypothetical protein